MFDALISQYFLEPRIVHRLPGRLRANIPALLRVQAYQKELENLLTRLLVLPEGISVVQVRCLTGNVLFEYDERIITEKEIVNWIRQIGKTVVREKDRILQTPIEKIPDVFDRFVAVIQESIRYRLDISKEVVIPNDVWQ